MVLLSNCYSRTSLLKFRFIYWLQLCSLGYMALSLYMCCFLLGSTLIMTSQQSDRGGIKGIFFFSQDQAINNIAGAIFWPLIKFVESRHSLQLRFIHNSNDLIKIKAHGVYVSLLAVNEDLASRLNRFLFYAILGIIIIGYYLFTNCMTRISIVITVMLMASLAILLLATVGMLSDGSATVIAMGCVLGIEAVIALLLIANRGISRYRISRMERNSQCVGCGYLLYGLREHRCPECGQPFGSMSVRS